MKSYSIMEVSRKQSCWALVVCTALVGIFLSPVLVFHKIFFDGDSLLYLYPYAAFFQQHLGVIWNSYIFSGFSGVSTVQFGFYNPFSWIAFRIFNFITAYHLLVALNLLIAALATYWFARRLRLPFTAALLAAIVYVFNAWSTHWSPNVLLDYAIALFPLMLVAVDAIIDGQVWFSVLLAGSVGMGLLCAHTEFIVIAFVGVGIYGLWRLWFLRTEGIKRLARPLLLLAIGVLVGVLIGLPQIENSRIFAAISTRSQGLNYAQAVDTSAALPADIFKYLLPNFSLRSLTDQEFIPYIGFMPLLLALAAMVALWRERKEVRFFTGLTVFIVLLIVKYSPLFWLMLKLPILQYFRGPSRWLMIADLALAILAGFGFEILLEKPAVREYLARWSAWVAWLVAGLATLATAVYLIAGGYLVRTIQHYFDTHLYAHTSKLPLDYYHQLIAIIVHDSFANISWSDTNFLIAFIFILATWLVFRYALNLSRLRYEIVLVGLVAANLIIVGWRSVAYGDQSFLLTKPALATLIQNRENNPSQYRIFTFLIDQAAAQQIGELHPEAQAQEMQYVRDGLRPNANLYWGIPSADGADTIATERSQRLAAYIGSEATNVFVPLSSLDIPTDQKSAMFLERLPVLSMLNVKYIISAYPLQSPKLLTVTNISDTSFDIPIYLYQNMNVLPRIYLARSVNFLPPDQEDATYDAITKNSDFSARTIIECSTCSAGSQSNTKDQVVVSRDIDGIISATTHTMGNRWLIISESLVPGWHATIDGKSTTIYPANFVFQGIYIPAGDHSVILTYTPPFLLKK